VITSETVKKIVAEKNLRNASKPLQIKQHNDIFIKIPVLQYSNL